MDRPIFTHEAAVKIRSGIEVLEKEYQRDQQIIEKIKRDEKIWKQEEMSHEFKDTLIELLRIQESCEYRGGENYLRYCPSLAPSAEQAAFIAHIGIEELDHAARARRILESLGVQITRARNLYQEKYILRIFQHPELFKSWAHLLMFNFLMDGAAGQQLAEFQKGPYGPWSLMIQAIEEEEQGHVEHGMNGIREWARTARGCAELQDGLYDWWPLVMDVFGADDAKSNSLWRYRKYNFKQIGNDQARSVFYHSVMPFLSSVGLNVCAARSPHNQNQKS